MRKSIKDPDGKYFKVIDLDTDQEIKGCTMADDETGNYAAYEMDGGKLRLDEGRQPIVLMKHGRIKLVDMREQAESPDGTQI